MAILSIFQKSTLVLTFWPRSSSIPDHVCRYLDNRYVKPLLLSQEASAAPLHITLDQHYTRLYGPSVIAAHAFTLPRFTLPWCKSAVFWGKILVEHHDPYAYVWSRLWSWYGCLQPELLTFISSLVSLISTKAFPRAYEFESPCIGSGRRSQHNTGNGE